MELWRYAKEFPRVIKSLLKEPKSMQWKIFILYSVAYFSVAPLIEILLKDQTYFLKKVLPIFRHLFQPP